ncbi:hypothetical protein [Pseudotamlana agarivorans]|uniref:hypothetical protein n=1 Tax=Pseudotamlana agarivorans TaxID=481183 RepID=UPI00082A6B94|nr:hypothetical protein [Tamlana agarivorans]
MSTKQNEAQTLLNNSKLIPEPLKAKWISRINFESEISIEDQVKALETEAAEIHHSITGGYPEGYGAETNEDEVSSDDVANAVVNNLI